MTKLYKVALLLIAVMGMGSMANATPFVTSYDDNFAAASTGGGSGNYYYFDEHQASQTYLGTGLMSVNELMLTLNTNHYGIVETLGFTFFLNGIDIGSTDFLVGGAPSQNLDFSFASIESLTGDWTLLMDVTTPVCSGCGSIRFTSLAPLTLVGAAAVPEPAPLALLGLGLMGLGLIRKRRG